VEPQDGGALEGGVGASMGRHSQAYDQAKITAELRERNSGFNAGARPRQPLRCACAAREPRRRQLVALGGCAAHVLPSAGSVARDAASRAEDPPGGDSVRLRASCGAATVRFPLLAVSTARAGTGQNCDAN
jgi:hypothetical protein